MDNQHLIKRIVGISIGAKKKLSVEVKVYRLYPCIHL